MEKQIKDEMMSRTMYYWKKKMPNKKICIGPWVLWKVLYIGAIIIIIIIRSSSTSFMKSH